MKLFLAGLKGFYAEARELSIPFILESFFYAEEDFYRYVKSEHCKDYLFDSGAFTFLNAKKNKAVNFDDYLTKYITAINDHDLHNFFELDIDSIVGIEKVEQMRKRLERETGKPCVPVWHRSRGKEYFIELCKNYSYIAIGGLAIKNISRGEYRYLNWFCETAHKYGTRIHGLGFTPIKTVHEYQFDTVDSTTWHNIRFGGIFQFADGKLTRITNPDKRIAQPVRRGLIHNLTEWNKFQNHLYYSKASSLSSKKD